MMILSSQHLRWLAARAWCVWRLGPGTLLRAIEQRERERTRIVCVLTGDLCGAVLPGEADIHVRCCAGADA